MPKVSFLNEVVTVEVERGRTVKDAADMVAVKLFEGFWASYHCSGTGRCLGSGCRVWVKELVPGAVAARTFWERIRPTHRGAIRLACQARVLGDVEVRTQPGTTFSAEPNMQWDDKALGTRWQARLIADDKADKADKLDRPDKPAAKAPAAPAAAPAAGEAKTPHNPQ